MNNKCWSKLALGRSTRKTMFLFYTIDKHIITNQSKAKKKKKEDNI